MRVTHPFGCSYRCAGLALLDQAGCGGHRLHRRAGVHVRAVQGVHPPLSQVESLQPDNRGPGRARGSGRAQKGQGGGCSRSRKGSQGG